MSDFTPEEIAALRALCEKWHDKTVVFCGKDFNLNMMLSWANDMVGIYRQLPRLLDAYERQAEEIEWLRADNVAFLRNTEQLGKAQKENTRLRALARELEEQLQEASYALTGADIVLVNNGMNKHRALRTVLVKCLMLLARPDVAALGEVSDE